MPTQITHCHQEGEIVLQKPAKQRYLPLAIVTLFSICFGLLFITYTLSPHAKQPFSRDDFRTFIITDVVAFVVAFAMSGSIEVRFNPKFKTYSITTGLLFFSRTVRGPLSDIDAVVIRRVVTEGRNGANISLTLRIDWNDPVRSAKTIAALESEAVYPLQDAIEQQLNVHVRWEE